MKQIKVDSINRSVNSSERKQNNSKAIMSLSSFEQDEEKPQSAGKRHSWKKTCIINKKKILLQN